MKYKRYQSVPGEVVQCIVEIATAIEKMLEESWPLLDELEKDYVSKERRKFISDRLCEIDNKCNNRIFKAMGILPYGFRNQWLAPRTPKLCIILKNRETFNYEIPHIGHTTPVKDDDIPF